MVFRECKVEAKPTGGDFTDDFQGKVMWRGVGGISPSGFVVCTGERRPLPVGVPLYDPERRQSHRGASRPKRIRKGPSHAVRHPHDRFGAQPPHCLQP
jgi:hypothetical protein